ncbi:hypothetical protein JW872_03295 [Candidatus Babeliales bacterium]|nr:hypothetical protein [Candidatus Babeliales bacterium]
MASFVEGLSKILLNTGSITKEDAQIYVQEFEKSSKESFDDFLLEEGLVDEQALLRALSSYYNVPATDVIGLFFDRELLTNIPEDVLTRNAMIPYELDGNILIVIASNPSDPNLLPILGDYVSADIQFHVGLKRDILEVIREFYEKSETEIDDEEENEEPETLDDILDNDFTL